MKGLRSYAAFTLIEVLVVAAIVGVLVALCLPAMAAIKVSGNRAKCLSNMRQIGLALQLYANENSGSFPPTTHTTGTRRIEQSWIYGIAPFLDNVDKVRVCPSDPPDRQKQILDRKATSYVLNELVFDSEEFTNVFRIPFPSKTLIAVILAESRTPSSTWDHVHSGEWVNWQKMLNDVQVDRHLAGEPAKSPAQRTKGSANYLYADGHTENISAADMKRLLDSGTNPAVVPTTH